jgi:homocitrate synthase NifV
LKTFQEDHMLIDATLREGEQLFGAYFDNEARRGIIRSLVAAQIEEIEIGCAGQDHLRELLPWAQDLVKQSGAQTQISVWCRLREDDLARAKDLGATRVNLGAPVSAAHLKDRLGLSRRGLFCTMERVLGRARMLGFDAVSVGLEDISRAEPDFALEAGRLAENLGASRIRLSDTVGVMTPPEIMELVRMFRLGTRVPIAVHCHNDFGMATANAVSALAAGASFADATVLGIGERAGIAALEEVAAHQAVRHGAHYDLKILAELALLVAKTAKIEIPRTKPVAGADIFACETGLHVQALLRDPSLFEPYAPERIGASRTIAGGGKSGQAAVREKLTGMGHHVPDHDLDELVSAVHRKSRSLARPLTDRELAALAARPRFTGRPKGGRAA